jgi:predicted ATPase
MRLEHIHIKNYKAFQNVVIKDIPPLAVFIGANGTGKSTLFDVLAFLRDCLRGYNIREALQMRGGFYQVISRGAENKAIEITLNFSDSDSCYRYYLKISLDIQNQVQVEKEVLEKNLPNKDNIDHSDLINFSFGKGNVLSHIKTANDFFNLDKIPVENFKEFNRNLVLNTFGSLSGPLHIRQVKTFLEKVFFLGDYPVSNQTSSATFEEEVIHDKTGKRLALLWSETPDETKQAVLNDLQRYIPDFDTVLLRPVTRTENKLEFKAKAFDEAFQLEQLSEGSLKLFQYLLKLHSPEESPLLCVSEPENDLYQSLLPNLMDEFDLYSRTKGQVFVSTHSPQLLNSVELESVYYLIKQPNGFTQIIKATDNDTLKTLADAGDKPGWLWSHQLFDGVDP